MAVPARGTAKGQGTKHDSMSNRVATKPVLPRSLSVCKAKSLLTACDSKI